VNEDRQLQTDRLRVVMCSPQHNRDNAARRGAAHERKITGHATEPILRADRTRGPNAADIGRGQQSRGEVVWTS